MLIFPTGNMSILSTQEVARLHDSSKTGLYTLFRQCALAVLNCNNCDDNAQHLMEVNAEFDIRVHQEPRGVKLELINPPDDALVDGNLVEGVRENLFSVLRDILYSANELIQEDSITDQIFEILRNSGVFIPGKEPNIVVCWGGHSINRTEYSYCKEVGYQLGLRKMDICTGCGPGAMKGPMKGAQLGFAKQRVLQNRLIGLSEPEIIAAETPNAIVNQLIIMPDIEKRLEAFVRLGHGIIVFPGGVGTAEEILYLLGILLHPDNRDLKFPLIFTGPSSSGSYFEHINKFIEKSLGKAAQAYYKIIIDDPRQVAQEMSCALERVKDDRKQSKDAYHFNWNLTIESYFQTPFEPTHKNMENLKLTNELPPTELAASLRRVMSGIVSGNIKREGISAIKKHGPFQLKGEMKLMQEVDALLLSFIKDGRMKLPAQQEYVPCYRINPE